MKILFSVEKNKNPVEKKKKKSGTKFPKVNS